MGSPVPRTVSAGNCDLNDHFFSPVKLSKATNSPAEFLTIINEGEITPLVKISPPTFFSHKVSLVTESMAITIPLVSETMILPKPDAVPADKFLLRSISQVILPVLGLIDARLPSGSATIISSE